MAKRDINLTRQRLLDAGLELLEERGVELGLRNIPVTDIAVRAGHTTGAVYQLWKRQGDYHRDLALYAIGNDSWADTTLLTDALLPLIEAGAPAPELIRVASNTYLDYLRGSRAFQVAVHFYAVAVHDAELREAIRAAYDRIHIEFSLLYTAMLEILALQMRAPYTVDHAAVAFTALAEGFALRIEMDPERVPLALDRPELEAAPSGWSLFACAIEAMTYAFTEPVGPTKE